MHWHGSPNIIANSIYNNFKHAQIWRIRTWLWLRKANTNSCCVHYLQISHLNNTLFYLWYRMYLHLTTCIIVTQLTIWEEDCISLNVHSVCLDKYSQSLFLSGTKLREVAPIYHIHFVIKMWQVVPSLKRSSFMSETWDQTFMCSLKRHQVGLFFSITAQSSCICWLLFIQNDLNNAQDAL